SVPQSRDYGAAGSAAPSSIVGLALAQLSFAASRKCFTRSCALIAPLKNFSRVAMTFIGASVKYEYEGDRERSDKGSTAQSADSHWRLRNPRAHDRQVPCARCREHWRVPFRLSARQHAFRLQRGEGRRFQSTNRKRRERSGDGRVAQSQRRKENPR